MESEYWREAQKGLEIDDYPDVAEDSIDFPQGIFVAFAVCKKECGNQEFIVDGGTQICDKCGKSMFRIVSKGYTLANDQVLFDKVKSMLDQVDE